MDRRRFLRRSVGLLGLAGAGALAPHRQRLRALGVNERLQVAVVGVRGRGNNLLRTFAALDDVDVRLICDVDRGVLERRVRETREGTRHRPEPLADFRRAVDDSTIDAIVLGTPDHWHAIPAILACLAGKDVYTEKPDGHNALESRTMAAAARKHRRVVQLGTQARSAPFMREAMDYLAAGSLGRVRYATAWESARQRSLGHPADRDPPAGVDYDMWLGPAPKRPFNPLRFHSTWRWFFDYGSGDLGNDGVHRLDYTRWGLETALRAEGKTLPAVPLRVSAHGGKLYFDDAQEWPDTLLATYDYGLCVLSYEMRISTPYPLHGESEGGAIYGDKGYVVLGNDRWRAYGPGGKLLRESKGESNLEATALHARDFVDRVRDRGRPAADLETIGHPTSMLCHLGNVAWRLGRTVQYDAASGTFGADDEANRWLTRAEYRAPWQLPRIDAV